MTVVSERAGLSSNRRLRRWEDVSGLLPDAENPTPIVRLNRLVPSTSNLYLKLEWMNPFGSVKDRAASFMLDALRRRGALDGRTLVEPTSGNTGIALAALAALEGVSLIVTVPDEIPEEKKALLRMLGAEVWETPDDLCPKDHPRDGAIALARSLIKSLPDQYVMPNQYDNIDNVRAHYETTGPEIWRQTEGRVRYFFAGLGTCGTVTGVGQFLKGKDPAIKIIAIKPQVGHRLPGLKNFDEASQPSIFDPDVIDDVILVDDASAYETTKRLHREEGLIVGPTTGAVVHAAIRYDIGEGAAVAISPDSGFRYASYFTEILGDEGRPRFLEGEE